VIPAESVELKANENYHQVVKRIRDSARHLQSGRAISANMTVEGRKLTLVSAYANPDTSAAERPRFFTNSLAQLVNKNTVMGIDANCVPDVTLDVKRTATSPYRNDGAQELHDLVTQHSLIDVARECLGKEPFFTSHHNVPDGSVTHTRIDQIYAPDLPNVMWEHVRLTHDFFGRPADALELDHEPIQIRTTTITEKRGQDLQTISEDIYENIAFTSELKSTIDFIIEVNDPAINKTWGKTWNQIKDTVRQMSLKETSRRKYKDNLRTQQLRKKRDDLKVKIDHGSADALDITQYMRLESEIAATVKEERSLYQRLEEVAYNLGKSHDIGSASFYRPWKPKGAAQWIRETFEADWSDTQNPARTGRKCTDTKAMATEITKYWSSLFEKKPTTRSHYADCLDTLKIGNRVLPPTAAKCDEEITQQEIASTCNELPTAKSAGPDRIPNKFYKVLSKTLAPILAEVFNEAHANGSFEDGLSTGIISLLYKKKERDDPRNYRPITLLNGDYKILMRILTARMNEAVVQFVSDPQNGFVPDSFLPENIMLLKLVQAYVEEEDTDAYFVFLDMEKAFDRCSWEFLIDALSAIGFNKGFVDYVKLMYSHDHPPKRKLYVNGYLGPEFPLGSGVAQGCPLSPLLFLLITEPLSRLVLKGHDDEGGDH